MIDYGNFRESLKNLELRNAYRKKTTVYPDEQMRESVDESVIQRFEICYDCLWKVLKRYLEEGLGIQRVPTAPKPMVRMALENDLLASSFEQWVKYINARIGTIHDYSGQKAKDAIVLMDDFIDDAIALYQVMVSRSVYIDSTSRLQPLTSKMALIPLSSNGGGSLPGCAD